MAGAGNEVPGAELAWTRRPSRVVVVGGRPLAIFLGEIPGRAARAACISASGLLASVSSADDIALLGEALSGLRAAQERSEAGSARIAADLPLRAWVGPAGRGSCRAVGEAGTAEAGLVSLPCKATARAYVCAAGGGPKSPAASGGQPGAGAGAGATPITAAPPSSSPLPALAAPPGSKSAGEAAAASPAPPAAPPLAPKATLAASQEQVAAAKRAPPSTGKRSPPPPPSSSPRPSPRAPSPSSTVPEAPQADEGSPSGTPANGSPGDDGVGGGIGGDGDEGYLSQDPSTREDILQGQDRAGGDSRNADSAAIDNGGLESRSASTGEQLLPGGSAASAPPSPPRPRPPPRPRAPPRPPRPPPPSPQYPGGECLCLGSPWAPRVPSTSSPFGLSFPLLTAANKPLGTVDVDLGPRRAGAAADAAVTRPGAAVPLSVTVRLSSRYFFASPAAAAAGGWPTLLVSASGAEASASCPPATVTEWDFSVSPPNDDEPGGAATAVLDVSRLAPACIDPRVTTTPPQVLSVFVRVEAGAEPAATTDTSVGWGGNVSLSACSPPARYAAVQMYCCSCPPPPPPEPPR